MFSFSDVFLIINLETINSVSLSQLYYTHTWLPLHIKVDLQSNGELVMSKYDNDKADKQEIDCSNIYDLYAVVCYINDDRKNLVSIINVGQSYHEHISANNSDSQWYIFNDISVSKVVGQEAVWFSLDWKIPCILYWISRNNKFDNLKISNPVITSKVFTESVYLNSSLKNSNFITCEEIPKSGKCFL